MILQRWSVPGLVFLESFNTGDRDTHTHTQSINQSIVVHSYYYYYGRRDHSDAALSS
jgi:hypothetical protein